MTSKEQERFQRARRLRREEAHEVESAKYESTAVFHRHYVRTFPSGERLSQRALFDGTRYVLHSWHSVLTAGLQLESPDHFAVKLKQVNDPVSIAVPRENHARRSRAYPRNRQPTGLVTEGHSDQPGSVGVIADPKLEVIGASSQ